MRRDIKDIIGVIVYWILIFILIKILFNAAKALYSWIKNK
jgi:hypothetical protein